MEIIKKIFTNLITIFQSDSSEKHILRYTEIISDGNDDLNIFDGILRRDVKVIYPQWWLVISYLGAILCFGYGLFSYNNSLIESIIAFIVASILLPPVHSYIESKLSFRFTWKIKFVLLSLFACWIICLHIIDYIEQESLEDAQYQFNLKKIEENNILKNNQLKAAKELNLKYTAFIDDIQRLLETDSSREVRLFLDSALSLKGLSIFQIQQLNMLTADFFYKQQVYDSAIKYYYSINDVSLITNEYHLRRAICYSGIERRDDMTRELREIVRSRDSVYVQKIFEGKCINLTTSERFYLRYSNALSYNDSLDYKSTIRELTLLLNEDNEAKNNGLIYLDCAKCYLKLNDSVSAKKDAFSSMKYGNSDAGLIYAGFVFVKARYHHSYGEYHSAIKEYTNLLGVSNCSSYKGLCYLERAKSYLYSNDTLSAVKDLRNAIKLKNSEAQSFYDEINPETEYYSHTISICSDGHKTNCIGRGCCSHHGGVVETKEIYKKMRRY